MKKYLSLNFLSLLGYLSFLALLLFFIVAVPVVVRLNNQTHDGGMGFFYFWSEILVKYYILHIIFSAITLALAAVEFFCKKKSKVIQIPIVLGRIHPLIFWIGLVLVFTPLYLYGLLTVYQLLYSL